MELPIETAVINLAKRPDRKKYSLGQFKKRPEFNVVIVKAKENKNGALGLWLTLKEVIKQKHEEKYIIVCEDDHTFTKQYTSKLLLDSITEGLKFEADILLGGVSWFNEIHQISSGLFWVDKFTGLQFSVIFNKFFAKILSTDFNETDIADGKIATLTQKKYIIYPFISIQKEFGYSDVTTKNNVHGFVDKIFKKSISKTKDLAKIKEFYKKALQQNDEPPLNETYEDIVIPTFITGDNESYSNISTKFADKPEFRLCFIEGANRWDSIVKIINIAVHNDDDVIVMCREDHVFTEYYSRDILFKNIIKGNELGLYLLLGGVGNYGQSVHITDQLFWIDNFDSCTFFIVYKSFFRVILDEINPDCKSVDDKLSVLTSRKMLIFPLISIRDKSSNCRYDSSIYLKDSDYQDPSFRLHRIQNLLT